MTAAQEVLAQLGIRLRHNRPGQQYLACPWCTGRNPAPLSVLVQADGHAMWHCHRCGQKGGAGREHAPDWRPQRPQRAIQAAPIDPEAVRKAELALEVWRAAHPLCDCEDCEPGRRYLTGRGITSWPERLFFHPACPFDRASAPALLAPVNAPGGLVQAIWRIKLTWSGRKITRLGLGPSKGCASRLYPAEDVELGIAEGVEDALALHALSGLPVWAALSAGNMAALILPSRFRRIVIAADRDGNGKGLAKARDLGQRLVAQGRHVEIVQATGGAKDANDVLIRRAAA